MQKEMGMTLLMVAIVLFSFSQLFFIFEVHDHHTLPSFLMEPELRKERLTSKSERAAFYIPGEKQNRVAVLIPYLGASLPPWFDAFAFSAMASMQTYDWFIFVADAHLRNTPRNVKLIPMDRDDYYHRIAQLDLTPPTEYANRTVFADAVGKAVTKKRYIMVELKPCLATMFDDYIRGYSHWAFADMDLLVGNLDDVLLPHLPTSGYDITTLSFGDTYRMYLRGQLTVHKNTPVINNMWRQCDHLSHLGQRFLEFHKSGDREYWRFQSAEGCISRVVADSNYTSVLVSATQISDAFQARAGDKESFFLGTNLLRCYEKPADLSRTNIEAFLQDTAHAPPPLLPVNGEVSAGTPAHPTLPTQLEPLARTPYKCEYWVAQSFQACLDRVSPEVDVVLSKGQFYTVVGSDKRYRTLGGACRKGGVAHFQGWKKQFYAFTTRPPSLDTHASLITDSGFIPIKLDHVSGLPTYGKLYPHFVPSSHVSHADLASVPADGSRITPSRLLQGSDVNTASSYCLKFGEDVAKCTCHALVKDIYIHQVRGLREEDGRGGAPSLTVVMVAWADDYFKGRLQASLESVPQGATAMVILATMHESYPPIVQSPVKATVVEVDISSECFSDGNTPPNALPDKVLYNIGLDLARTENIMILPAGMQLVMEDGAVSHIIETISHSPVALVIPTYGSDDGGHPMGQQEQPQHYHEQQAHIKRFVSTVPVTTYPSHADPTNTCGRDQPEVLRLQPENHHASKIRSDISQAHHISMNEEALTLPFVFSRKQSPHGWDFVRFPEEYNGVGCYGSAVLSVLKSAGYMVRWVKGGGEHDDLFARSTSDSFSARLPGSTLYRDCQCVQGQNDAGVYRFSTHLNKYMLRVESLAKGGTDGLYSHINFEKQFFEEQEKLKQGYEKDQQERRKNRHAKHK